MAREWIETTIGEQATLQRGIDITRAEQRAGDVPVVSSGGVSSYHDTAPVKGPGVILGRKGVVGSVYFVTVDYWPHDTTLWVKNFHGNAPRFVYYFFKEMAPRLAAMDVGSANPTLNRNHVHPMATLWSPLSEQRAIAHILGTLDDKIELNRKMNETLEAIARAIFKSWFVDFDPVRAKAEGRRPYGMDAETAALFPNSFEQSPLRKIPKGWCTRPLYDCARFVNGAVFRNSDFSEEQAGLPIIKIAELKNGITSQTKFTVNDCDAKYKIGRGEILFSWSGSPDTSIDTFLWCGDTGWLNQHIFKVFPHREDERPFVYYLLRFFRPTFVEIARNKQTTGLGHVTAQDMKRIHISFPDDRVLGSFCDTVAPLFERTLANDFETMTLANIRDALLPKLISGQIRVKDVERFIEGVDTKSEDGEGGLARPKPLAHVKTTSESHDSNRPPIDELDTDQVMMAFRQATRGRGAMTREELIKEVSMRLGYQRLRAKIEQALRSRLRAAILRKIIGTDGEYVFAATIAMHEYTHEEVHDALRSVMRKDRSYEREEVIAAVARHLGFARLTESIAYEIKRSINSAIRCGILGYEGKWIWRES